MDQILTYLGAARIGNWLFLTSNVKLIKWKKMGNSHTDKWGLLQFAQNSQSN